ncbi:glycoside hydrolase family 88 protein [Paenibacillus qinlingensis]|uniref:glycoside hydrolase family 88 protein n=1 Tax=Paenibacillus qinlingensis TaxID=1837343 RepID=UPI00156471B6|nr:glycoside hydrolase family 88 protein [Paenibacillus qinlingensis]NQX60468.1 glycoside hydrolase family 88 protein [Paenibacillus qinlingensis]
MRQVHYLPAHVISESKALLPEGKQITRGWRAAHLGEGQEQLSLLWHLHGDQLKQTAGQGSRLRITVALDYRDAQQVDVILRQSNEWIGAIDIRYAYVFQPFELLLTEKQTAAALHEGVRLELKGGKEPLWVFNAHHDEPERVLFAPHLLMGEPNSRIDEALNTMLSLSSLQPFGWMEGCVLDGLHSLQPILGEERVNPILDLHFSQFFNEQGELHYEDLHGRQADGTFTTIEATLPLAVIVKYRMNHPVILKALEFFEATGRRNGGAVIDEDMVSAEGSYTVAYPLAVMARQFNRQDMAEQAIAQILLRRDCLAREQHVYLRFHARSQEHTFRSWARAFAWYCLGLVKTCVELKDSPFANLAGIAELEAEIIRVAQVALHWRQPSGLWSCFVDDSATGIDTSGSAGISAAFALAASRQLLPNTYMTIAKHNLLELSGYLSPDGILTGVAQHNAGGMELQRSGYRVYSQMGLGLWAQLYAYTRED